MNEGSEALERELAALGERLELLRAEVGRVFLGHGEVVEELLVALAAGGHVLLEGVPGLGKTTLVKGLAAALDMSFRRIQFTPDLMPGDVLGTRVLEEDERGKRRFRFEAGPVFANVVLADEINRATPRTQSALLEAMQESSVTLFGETRTLEEPFFLVATENPIEMEGTYPLPEAQLDRFLFKVVLATPSLEELELVLGASAAGPREAIRPVLGREAVRRMRELARSVPTSSDVIGLVARLVLATHPGSRNPPAPEEVRRYVRYGASPRAGQAVLWTAQARALLHGRPFVSPGDVAAVSRPALRHRLILGYEGEAAGVSPDELVDAALEVAGGDGGKD